jgi:hypothetical protein
VAATALDQIVQDYAREKQRAEAEIGAQRQAWEEESARIERERKEQDDNLKKQRQREIEDYEYKKALERKKAQDKYEEELRLVEKKNQERQEALEKGWRQREAELKEREDELTHLRLSGHPKTGQRWSGQNRPTGRGRGLSCFTLQLPVQASLFSYANSEDHI